MPNNTSNHDNALLWGGFLFAARVAEHINISGGEPTLDNSLAILGQVADGHLSLTDPERAGAGFDTATQQMVRQMSVESVARDTQTAQRIRAGLNKAVDEVKDV